MMKKLEGWMAEAMNQYVARVGVRDAHAYFIKATTLK